MAVPLCWPYSHNKVRLQDILACEKGLTMVIYLILAT